MTRSSSFDSRAAGGARARVLAQWRGLDLEPLEKARADRARSLATLVPKVFTSLGMDRKRTEAEIGKVWNDLIDPNVVAHAQPSGIRNGTLFVTVDHSAWLYDIIQYRRHEILERLQHCFGKEFIARISFRVG
jgi:hypothetical protein